MLAELAPQEPQVIAAGFVIARGAERRLRAARRAAGYDVRYEYSRAAWRGRAAGNKRERGSAGAGRGPVTYSHGACVTTNHVIRATLSTDLATLESLELRHALDAIRFSRTLYSLHRPKADKLLTTCYSISFSNARCCII